ncbi:lipopolysaccharide biosynthesis protein [Thermoflexibacter ruber]|uniref:Membrane protein involved in the export of O-antigen and teichoic acid n=1 Tax=Thermoflexibacter ruber TaxID=1003 RepID=A0A1I2ISN5_9BACT|nr:lipopolysaccharide biosynthesis protein [Thermoflexibacter ruber]SFF45274.1 Membrane protein involved in the export of O-antigen and teichoic acid [Thermoflexibacter ruber]
MSKSSIRSKVISSLFWTTGATLINVFSQIAYTSIMGRLLDPSAYGLMAMGDIVLRFVSYFSGMGLSQALVQKANMTTEDIRAAFTSSIMLGLFLYSLFWILSPFSIYIFPVEELVPVIRTMALSFVISSLFLTANALLRKELKFNITAKITVISGLIASFGIGLPLAYLGYGVWSLVVSSLAQSMISGVWAYLIVRHDIRLSFIWKNYKPLLGFGLKISINSFLIFLSYNLNTVLIGNLLGSKALGYYNRASYMAQLPIQYFTQSISQVLFPAMSKLQHDTEKLRKAYLTSSGYLAFAIIPTCVGMSIAGEPLILVFLGTRWEPSVPIFQVLAFAPIFNFLAIFGNSSLDATNRVGLKIKITLIHIAIMLIGIGSFYRLGSIGLAFAIVIADFVKYVILLFITKKYLQYTTRQWFETYLPAFINLLYLTPIFLLIRFFTNYWDIAHLISLILFIFAGGLCILLGFLSSPRVLIILEIKNLIRPIAGKPGLGMLKFLIK